MTLIDLERSDLIGKVEGIWGGRNEWRNNSFMTDTSCIGDLNKEVVPICVIDRIIPKYENQWRSYEWYTSLKTYYSGYGDKNPNVNVSELYSSSKLEKYDSLRKEFEVSYIESIQANIASLSQRAYYVDNVKCPEEFLQEIRNQARNIITCLNLTKTEMTEKSFSNISLTYGVPELEASAHRFWSGYRKYKQILGHFLRGKGWEVCSTKTYINNRNLRYLVGSYFLSDVSDFNNPINLLALVTKPNYLEYISYSLALGKGIDPRVLQVWVHPSFDVPRGIWKGVRPHMRKEFLIPMYDAGVPIIEKEDFGELFKQFHPPKISDIREHKKWLLECSIEAINEIKTKQK